MIFSELKNASFLLCKSYLQLQAVGLDDHCRSLPIEIFYSVLTLRNTQHRIYLFFFENPGRAHCTAILQQPSHCAIMHILRIMCSQQEIIQTNWKTQMQATEERTRATAAYSSLVLHRVLTRSREHSCSEPRGLRKLRLKGSHGWIRHRSAAPGSLWICLCLKPSCGKLFPGQRQKS